jgi:hypothetical protein
MRRSRWSARGRPPPSEPVAPLNAATGVTAATAFSWSAVPDTIYEVAFVTTTTTGSGKAFYALFTTATTATIPVVPELALPLNQSFAWRVSGFGPNASADDGVSATNVQFVTPDELDCDPHWLTSGTQRAFTTAP